MNELKNLGHKIKVVENLNRVDAILILDSIICGGADRRGDDKAIGY